MDKSAPPAQLHAPPAQRGLFMFGKSFTTPGIHKSAGDLSWFWSACTGAFLCLPNET